MRKHLSFPTILQLSLGLLLLFVAGVAKASPANGFALYVGPIASRQPYYAPTTRGISIYTDAQMAYNNSWSFDPYLQLSYETSNGASYKVVHGTAGLQVRYWLGTWFLGGQYLFHDESYRQNGKTYDVVYGPALGAAVGWAGNNHWTIMLEVNSFENQGFSFTSANRRTDLQLLFGYRW